jgi:hypothetical protein
MDADNALLIEVAHASSPFARDYAQNVGNSLAAVEPMHVDSSGEICKPALLRHNLFVY